MKQIVIDKKGLNIEEYTVPNISPNEILVRVSYSLVSTGTELASIGKRASILTALKNPELRSRFFSLVKKIGLFKATRIAKDKLSKVTLLGYSNAGIVIEVGKNVKDIAPGDKVACGGGGYATHANYVAVPRNLAVKIPNEVSLKEAAFTTVGSIALQAVRRAKPELKEKFIVIGLGLVGLLTVQELLANGVDVLAVDIDDDNIKKAKKMGIIAINSLKENVDEAASIFTERIGADCVIITAATKSSKVINKAMELTRKKGRVVIVGDVGLNLKREQFYKKELDLFISTSYGPGRYDPTYEEKGIDYPIGYVRWTENRNMQAFLELLKNKKVDVKPLIDAEFKIEQAVEAYEKLKQKKIRRVIFKYEKEPLTRKIEISSGKSNYKGKIKVGLIGPGNFARAFHLPNLSKISDFKIYAIAALHPQNAKSVAKQHNAKYYTTDARRIIEDNNIDLVVITTRHNLHGKLVIDALKSGKHVFVEKPLTIYEAELEKIEKIIRKSEGQILMVGHNRRYSPFIKKIKENFSFSPKIMHYRVNAGYYPKEHWTQNPEEGGGRILGEGVHFFDVFNYLSDSRPRKIEASSISNTPENVYCDDNIIATINYENGDVANLIYTSIGSPKMDKEYMEIFGQESSAKMDDFTELTIYKRKEIKIKGKQDKGHYNELLELAGAIKGKVDVSKNLEQALLATKIAFEVQKQIKGVY